MSAPAPPSTDSSVSAPTPSFAVDRVVAAEAVDLEALGRGVERERHQVRALELDAARRSGSSVNASPRVGAPLTSAPSLPASPFDPCPSRRRCSRPACRCRRRRSWCRRPSRRRGGRCRRRRSACRCCRRRSGRRRRPRRSASALASSVFFASTVIESLPSPPLTMTVNVPSAGTVWSPSAALSQSEPLLSPPVVWPCTSRPPDTDTVTLSSAPSRLSVAVAPSIDAELTAASAGTAVAAKPAASAVAERGQDRRAFHVESS